MFSDKKDYFLQNAIDDLQELYLGDSI